MAYIQNIPLWLKTTLEETATYTNDGTWQKATYFLYLCSLAFITYELWQV